MNDTDTKQSAGYFREKAIIGLSTLTGDEVDKAILKVTSHMLKAPKEKYMQSLLAASYGHTKQHQKGGLPVNEYIVRELEKRSHTHNWIVVLKTMVVLHRLLADGSNEVVAVICRYQSVFSFGNIKELADTASGAAQKFFIQEYMRYLEERTVSQTTLGYHRRIETKEFDDYMDSLNASDLVEPFEALLAMLDALLQINYREAIVDNFCTMEAHQSIIRDGKTVFQLTSKRIVFVLGGFEDLSLSLKKKWLQLYERYDAAAAKLKALFDSMILSYRTFAEPIPQLKQLPETLLKRLEQNVRGSTKPHVESLESLGIQRDEPPTVTERRLATPPVASKEPELAALSSAASATPSPAKPAFTMDDLFQTAPPQQSQAVLPQQQALLVDGHASCLDPVSSGSNNCHGGSATVSAQGVLGDTGDFGGAALDAWSTGAPTGCASDWSTGAPAGSAGWSTGVPQLQPQQQQEFNGFAGGDGRTHQGGPPQQTQPMRPPDPFKSLYVEAQQGQR